MVSMLPDEIDEVIQTKSSIEAAENPGKVEVKNGVVRFEHVNFRYPGAEEDVLHDIDFVAESGKTTAIIGSTGCGKSTLVNLIPRLYDVTGGSITLDGKDIRRITMKDLRDEIGFVPQKGVLFSGTIASNLRLEKMMRQMKRLQKQRKLRRQLSSSKQKMTNTKRRSPRAEATSPGGQKQRLAIARAILADNKILILVMKDGDIIEQGTHTQLLAQNASTPNYTIHSFESTDQTCA